MSVLQEYESVRSSMGYRKFDAISNYLEEKCPKEVVDKYYEEMNSILDLPFCEFVEKGLELKKKYKIILLNDIIFKEEEFQKFNNWYNKSFKPFEIFACENGYAICLDQDDYIKKSKKSILGNGHDYERVFKDYINSNFNDLKSIIKYDSKNSIFCAYCETLKQAEDVCYELSKLYKDKDKMIELITNKEKYNSIQEIKI